MGKWYVIASGFKPLRTNPTKWSNTLKQFITADEMFEYV